MTAMRYLIPVLVVVVGLAVVYLTPLTASSPAWQPAATPPRVLEASGMIEAEEVAVAAETSGRVVAVLADEGDSVIGGQVLVRLDTSLLDDQMREAEAAVHAAEAALDDALRPVTEEEIAIARAEVAGARAAREGAAAALRNALDRRDNPLELESRINEARSQVEIAAQQVEAARAQLAEAEAGRDLYRFSASDEDKTRYQVYLNQVEAARAAIARAEAVHAGMEGQLAGLLEIRRNPLSLEAEVNRARSELDVAEHTLAVAEAALAVLEAGPRAEDVAVAEAELEAARAALELLRVQRDKMVLRSPVSGRVSSRSIEPGEVAAAGRTLLTVTDLDRVTLRVYIAESDIGRVSVGQPVDVSVDTFPDRLFSGAVSHIASRAEFTPKNMQTREERVKTVFAVECRLSNAGQALKPGMPADAVIHLEAPVGAPQAQERASPAVSPATATPSVPPPTPSPPLDATRREQAAPLRLTATPTTMPTPMSTPGQPPAASPTAALSPTTAAAPPPPAGKIVYATHEDGTYRLWAAAADGLERRLVAEDMHQPDVRGDGLIVVNGEGTHNRESLFTVWLDGSGLTEVSANANDVNPRWAPDGWRLLYVSEQLGDLVLQDGPQRAARRLSLRADIVPLIGRRPAWVDDGRVVYQGCDVWRGGSLCGLYLADVAGGSEPRRLVDDVHATAPAAHGPRIAYMTWNGRDWDLYLLEPGRGDPVRLTGEGADEGIPFWSPDGEWLGFLSNRGGAWTFQVLRPGDAAETVTLFELDSSPGPDWTQEQVAWTAADG